MGAVQRRITRRYGKIGQLQYDETVRSPTEHGITVTGRPTPLKPDKGEKDGSCNFTHCQRPLLGTVQYYMDGNFTGRGRLYYCRHCAEDCIRWDNKIGDPVRCTLDEDTL